MFDKTSLMRSSPLVALELLGWRLCANGVTGIIAETEAYHGEEDLACHAAKGHTPRTATHYGPPGTLYVYLCYGMYHLLNLVTDIEGVPSAVLIRGLIIEGLDQRRSNGPGKVAKLLGATLTLVTTEATKPHLDAYPCVPPIGVEYAGTQWAAKPWRWRLPGFPAVETTRRVHGVE